METRAAAETGVGTRSDSEGGEEESSCIQHIKNEAKQKTRHCHSAPGIISVERR